MRDTRSILGSILVGVTFWVFLHGIINFHQLRTGIREVDKVQLVYTPKPGKYTDTDWDAIVSPVEWVEKKYTYGAGELSGEYQLRDDEGNISVMKFCNMPHPDLPEHKHIVIRYYPFNGTNCSHTFVSARVY